MYAMVISVSTVWFRFLFVLVLRCIFINHQFLHCHRAAAEEEDKTRFLPCLISAPLSHAMGKRRQRRTLLRAAGFCVKSSFHARTRKTTALRARMARAVCVRRAGMRAARAHDDGVEAIQCICFAAAISAACARF